ncbi:hypothetical protein [Cohnella sp.]|uniref:hypothetical protein n=1 Tax=Cohnella sp. TaxID=1883426 RepID=UPI0035648A16
MEGQLFTWEVLATLAGASSLVFLIVQYTKKSIDRVAPWLPTDLYAVIVSTVMLTLAQLAIGGDPLDWRLYLLSIANGFWVAAAAGQMHNKVLSPPSGKVKQPIYTGGRGPDVYKWVKEKNENDTETDRS